MCKLPILTTFMLLIAAPILPAGTVQVADPDIWDYSPTGGSNLVRGPGGELYCLYVEEEPNGDHAIRLRTGAQLQTVLPFVFNDASSGLNGTYPANKCALAIDSQGVLHAIWMASFHSLHYYQKYYRSHDPVSGMSSSVVDLTASMGSNTARVTDCMDILVGAGDIVWTTVQQTGSSGTSNRKDRLIRAPAASGGAFASVGVIQGQSGYNQVIQLAEDSLGRIHCSFYDPYIPATGQYAHRFYDPSGSGWSALTVLGNTIDGQDRDGRLAADSLGNVHVAFIQDFAQNPAIIYRRWNGSTWEPAVVVAAFTTAQVSPNKTNTLSLSVRESDGHAWLGFRDFGSEGEYVVHEKALADSGFSWSQELLPPSSTTNVYFSPMSRGTPYPAFNNTGLQPEFTLRRGLAAPFQLVYVDILAPGETLEPCASGSVGGDILRVNGSSGGMSRHVAVTAGESVTVEIDSPAYCAGGPADFALFGFAGVPAAGDVSNVMFGGNLVSMCFLPAPPILALGSTPVSLNDPDGNPTPIQVSLQALVRGCGGGGQASNLLVLDVLP